MSMADWPSGLNASLIDAGVRTPLYHQIYLLLRDGIRRGELDGGRVLPGEIDLAALFNVSRVTIKRALNELAADALVSRHRGRGTIVKPSKRLSVISGSMETLMESLRAMGDETEVQLLDVANVVPSESIAAQLGLANGEKVQRAVRLRTIEGGPFSYLVSYVPLKLASSYSKSELASKPLLALLKRAGARIDEAEQWITAIAADPTVASALKVATGSPLLKIERRMVDVSGTPVQLIHGHYRPDRFVYFVRQSNLSEGAEIAAARPLKPPARARGRSAARPQ